VSTPVRDLLWEDDELTVWWGNWIECEVAISRLRRDGVLNEESEREARTRLSRLANEWAEIDPTDDIRLLASLVSKAHPLKAADALQLAAALRWCEGNTSGANFVCLDNQLRQAAEDESFGVLPERGKL
jgi:predicted nucleic acid-binding protein